MLLLVAEASDAPSEAAELRKGVPADMDCVEPVRTGGGGAGVAGEGELALEAEARRVEGERREGGEEPGEEPRRMRPLIERVDPGA